jgi:4-hydroxy-3-methylbut-2-enyl diphosphate reductase IspH
MRISAAATGKPSLEVLLCSPGGFCAGVVRAIDSVERALARYGPPVFTAGASAPEVLVEQIIDAFSKRYAVSVETASATAENVFFPLPRLLRVSEAAE